MSFKVSVGEADFSALREQNAYYVDKTEIIYELVHETGNKVTLFTRPRRFGKTLMMSMLESFFSIGRDSREIFSGLAVTKHEQFCKEWMNRYPVLFLSFKDVEAENFDDAYDMLRARLADVSRKLADLAGSGKVNRFDAETLIRLQAEKSTPADVKNSLKTIMRMMNAVYGRQVILLIDEYDVPLAKANEKNTAKNEYYSRMLDVMKSIMSIALKDNEFLKFAVVTGCLRIAKESIFTGTNNFASCSVLDEDFSGYFGFSEKEVEDILAAAGRLDKAEVVREWYNGYIFGDSRVYCPWDVINYVSALRKRRDAKPGNYWKNTSHNGILLTFVKRTDFRVKGKFEILMNGGTIWETISDELTYDTLHASEDNLWSVLLMTGYVTKTDAEESGGTISLKIPNREVASIFEDTVVKLFRDTIDNGRQRSMMEAFWTGDEEGAGKAVSELLWKTISFNDYHEDYYHAFLAGAFTGLGYEVSSNKERGLGRPDILIKDEDHRRAVIIEAKKSKRESDMNKDCDTAIRQMITKKYAGGLCGYEHVLCYGIAFFQKQARVKLLTEDMVSAVGGTPDAGIADC